MFSMDFFKDIDTATIHKQKPPIDQEIIDSINKGINEEYDHQSSQCEDKPKYYESQILFDNTIYEGEWLKKRRHGKGTLYKIDPSNQQPPQKIYSGDWYKDHKHGEGHHYHKSYSLTSKWSK